MKYFVTASLLLCSFFCIVRCQVGNKPAPDVSSLSGVGAICIRVDSMNQTLQKQGILGEDLRIMIESMFRTSGITLDSICDANSPQLHVRMMCLPAEVQNTQTVGLAYYIRLEFIQVCQVPQSISVDGQMKKINMYYSLPTWSKETLVVSSSLQFSDNLHKDLRSLAESFINDYLTVNPKK